MFISNEVTTCFVINAKGKKILLHDQTDIYKMFH